MSGSRFEFSKSKRENASGYEGNNPIVDAFIRNIGNLVDRQQLLEFMQKCLIRDLRDRKPKADKSNRVALYTSQSLYNILNDGV